MPNKPNKTQPLNFENWQKPGAYKLASAINESTLNPGDLLVIKQYITGYGAISGIKIVSYISSELFLEGQSKLESGFKKNPTDKNLLHWGGDTIDFLNCGLTVFPASMFKEGWLKSSEIFDIEQNSNAILTERALPEAPFTYKLKIKKNARAGQHYMAFYMTYYNGSEWKCLEEKVPFKINNKFEQYSTSLSIVAAIALIVTIFHDGLYPIYDAFTDIAKYIYALRRS